MAQQPVETILVRQLADYLSVPVIVFDPARTAVFYNEPAERLLGVRFDETGRVTPEEAERLIEVSDDRPAPIEEAKWPAVIALRERRPAHARHWVRRRSDGVRFQVEITAFPLIGQGDALLGAVVMFWERDGT
jgi:PAS domain-containing protein